MFYRSVTTLNIETSSARVLSVKGGRVRKWGDVPLAHGALKDTLVIDPAGVGSAIDELFRSSRISKSGVLLVSLTGFRSVTRIVTLPKLPATLMKEAIRWTARREMPIPLEELYLSWQVIGTQNTEQTIFLVGTPRSLLDSLYQALRKARIKPRAIELKPLALARIANRAEAIIINLETGSMSTAILVKGIPEVMHTMIVGSEELLLEDRVQKLTDDLSRTVSFYNNDHPEHPLGSETSAFLTGEMVSDHVLVDLVQKSIAYPVESPDLGVKLPPDLPVPRYAVNIGLALRKMLPRRRDKATLGHSCSIKINVLPAKYRH